MNRYHCSFLSSVLLKCTLNRYKWKFKTSCRVCCECCVLLVIKLITTFHCSRCWWCCWCSNSIWSTCDKLRMISNFLDRVLSPCQFQWLISTLTGVSEFPSAFFIHLFWNRTFRCPMSSLSPTRSLGTERNSCSELTPCSSCA